MVLRYNFIQNLYLKDLIKNKGFFFSSRNLSVQTQGIGFFILLLYEKSYSFFTFLGVEFRKFLFYAPLHPLPSRTSGLGYATRATQSVSQSVSELVTL